MKNNALIFFRVLKVPNIEIEKEKKDDEKDMATPTSGGNVNDIVHIDFICL